MNIELILMHFFSLFLLMANKVSVKLKVTHWESVKLQKYHHLPKISQTTKYIKHDQTALDHKTHKHTSCHFMSKTIRMCQTSVLIFAKLIRNLRSNEIREGYEQKFYRICKKKKMFWSNILLIGKAWNCLLKNHTKTQSTLDSSNSLQPLVLV